MPAVEGDPDRHPDPHAERGRGDRDGGAFAQPAAQRYRMTELQHRPAALSRDPAQARSGLTALGWPTASSSGTSELESE